MRSGTIPGLDQQISRICLGSMIISRARSSESFALLDAALGAGLTTLDTANVYAGGESERCIGDWLKARRNRAQVVLCSKGCHHDADRQRVTAYDLTADLMTSLARLQTDYIDLYMLHRDDPSQDVGPLMECFNEHYTAGRIRAFGASNWTHQRVAEANAYAQRHGLRGFSASSPHFSLAEQINSPWGNGCVSIGGTAGTEARQFYRQTGLGVFAYSSLARGLFSGRIDRDNYATSADSACQRAYCHEVNFQRLDRVRELAASKGMSVPQLALAWVLNQDFNIFALVGAATAAEIEANVAIAETRLSAAELTWLDAG